MTRLSAKKGSRRCFSKASTQRKQQGRNLTARLHEGLTEVYKRFKDDPDAVDLDAEATGLITAQGLQVQPEGLEELVIGRSTSWLGRA